MNVCQQKLFRTVSFFNVFLCCFFWTRKLFINSIKQCKKEMKGVDGTVQLPLCLNFLFESIIKCGVKHINMTIKLTC